MFSRKPTVMGSFYRQLALPGLESPRGGTSILTLIVVRRLVLIVGWSCCVSRAEVVVVLSPSMCCPLL